MVNRSGGKTNGSGGGGAGSGAGGIGSAVTLNGDGFSAAEGDKEGGPHPESPLPGYAAGYDAGFRAGLLAASPVRGPPVQMPVAAAAAAAEGGAGASEDSQPPFLALLEDFPDLFLKEVLERLHPVDLALLGRTGSAVRTAVKGSDLPRVGGSATGPTASIRSFCQSLSQIVWAVANGCPWQTPVTCATIAGGGNLELLKWARERGCPWSVGTCNRAVVGGHLEVLRWARENDCPWAESTCRHAARAGRLDVLQWAREHGCPWNASKRAPGDLEVGTGTGLPVG